MEKSMMFTLQCVFALLFIIFWAMFSLQLLFQLLPIQKSMSLAPLGDSPQVPPVLVWAPDGCQLSP
jgi:hypothetical protein